MAEKEQPKLVGNKSDGYNCKYASLGDLVIAGVELPPMRVAPLTNADGNPVLGKDGQPIEYIEALVDKTWVRGARIVIPSGNKMNEAQMYGSAMTYARRYTAFAVLGIATEDDKKIETTTEADAKANEQRAIDELKVLYERAGGADFDKWVKDCGGISADTYPQMKAKLLKQINDNAEKEKKND